MDNGWYSDDHKYHRDGFRFAIKDKLNQGGSTGDGELRIGVLKGKGKIMKPVYEEQIVQS